MKTLEQLKELTSKCLDGRDFNRLAKFIPYNMIKDFGMEPNEEYNNEERWNSTVVEFTRENVLKQLEEDVRFGSKHSLMFRHLPSPRRGIGPVLRAARPSRGTWSSPVASRAPATSTSETWFGR